MHGVNISFHVVWLKYKNKTLLDIRQCEVYVRVDTFWRQKKNRNISLTICNMWISFSITGCYWRHGMHRDVPYSCFLKITIILIFRTVKQHLMKLLYAITGNAIPGNPLTLYCLVRKSFHIFRNIRNGPYLKSTYE